MALWAVNVGVWVCQGVTAGMTAFGLYASEAKKEPVISRGFSIEDHMNNLSWTDIACHLTLTHHARR
jgi:hypothetical protein